MIDLDALATELVAAGIYAEMINVKLSPHLYVAGGLRVILSGRVYVDGGHIRPKAWVALDIIRRHVEPRPADDLRERVRSAVDDNLWVGRGSEVDKITDAVLAVIGGPA